MSQLPHSRFSTDDLPERDRLASWKEDISLIFDLERAPLEDPEPFHANFDLFHFGQSVLAHLDSSPGRYVRSARKSSRDGMDSILLQLFLEGGVQFGVGQRTTYGEAGDIVVFDLAQPVDNINRRFRHITAVWARATIEAVVPDIGRWHGLNLPRDNPAVALLRQHMISSYELAPRFSLQEGRRVEEATLALAGAAMSGNSPLDEPTAPTAIAEVLAYQIKRHIRENLGATDQAPEQLAHRFGISRRKLYQLFEPVGGIARYQRISRLKRCMADLQNPAQAHLQISEIAYRWGFRHAATFNANFRAAFGVTPSEARQTAREGAVLRASQRPRSRSEEGARGEHHQWLMSIGQ